MLPLIANGGNSLNFTAYNKLVSLSYYACELMILAFKYSQDFENDFKGKCGHLTRERTGKVNMQCDWGSLTHLFIQFEQPYLLPFVTLL